VIKESFTIAVPREKLKNIT